MRQNRTLPAYLTKSIGLSLNREGGIVPTAYHIDAEHQVVRSRAWGVLTDVESSEHYRRLAAEPAFQRTYRQVCDLRGVTALDLSADAIRGLAQSSVFAVGVRRAFVASDDTSFGLARMLQTFCDIEGSEVGVFRSLAEAEAWLQLTPGDMAEPEPR